MTKEQNSILNQILGTKEFIDKFSQGINNRQNWLLNYELGNPLNENQLNKTIKNAQDLKKSVDFNTAIGYIGDKFNFYRYPLSDLALANYEDKSKTSSGTTTSTTSTSAAPSNGGGTSGMGGSGGTGGGTGGY